MLQKVRDSSGTTTLDQEQTRSDTENFQVGPGTTNLNQEKTRSDTETVVVASTFPFD